MSASSSARAVTTFKNELARETRQRALLQKIAESCGWTSLAEMRAAVRRARGIPSGLPELEAILGAPQR